MCVYIYRYMFVYVLHTFCFLFFNIVFSMQFNPNWQHSWLFVITFCLSWFYFSFLFLLFFYFYLIFLFLGFYTCDARFIYETFTLIWQDSGLNKGLLLFMWSLWSQLFPFSLSRPDSLHDCVGVNMYDN